MTALWGGQDGYGQREGPTSPCVVKFCLRVASININGISVVEKRKEEVEIFKRGRLDVLGIQETYLVRGCRVVKCIREVNARCGRG